MVTLKVEHEVSSVHIGPGEAFTVFLQVGRCRTIQVEARVRKDGVPELFCNQLEAKRFKGWSKDGD